MIKRSICYCLDRFYINLRIKYYGIVGKIDTSKINYLYSNSCTKHWSVASVFRQKYFDPILIISLSKVATFENVIKPRYK